MHGIGKRASSRNGGATAIILVTPQPAALAMLIGMLRNKQKETTHTYRGDINYDVKGSVCFALQFAPPPFSPPLPYVVQIPKQNRRRTFDIINT